MATIPDMSKFNLKGIMDNVKAMIGQTPIPEASKEDPVNYYLSELSKAVKALADLHSQESDAIAKIDATLGSLHQSLTSAKPAKSEAKETAPKAAEEETAKETDKKSK